MQNEKASTQQNNEHDPSLRTQRLLEYLGDLWQRPHEPSPETLKRITAFVLHLPEQYRATGLKAIAEHFVNTMSLRFLEIMATFQQKAEQEGIDPEEVAETFEDVLPKWFQPMMELSKQVSVQSLDDLVVLSNITIGLYRLYHTASAEGAQSAMYELPKLYRKQLAQEHLLLTSSTTAPITSFATQGSSLPDFLQEFKASLAISFTPWQDSSPKLVQPSLWEKSAA